MPKLTNYYIYLAFTEKSDVKNEKKTIKFCCQRTTTDKCVYTVYIYITQEDKLCIYWANISFVFITRELLFGIL